MKSEDQLIIDHAKKQNINWRTNRGWAMARKSLEALRRQRERIAGAEPLVADDVAAITKYAEDHNIDLTRDDDGESWNTAVEGFLASGDQ